MGNGKFKQSKKANASKKRVAAKKAANRNSRRIDNNRGNVTVAAQRPTIQRGYLPFGREYFARLPYVENYYISANGSSGTTTVERVYATNDLWDPRYGTLNGGHQPLQYDALAAHYERVWTHACSVVLTFSNPTADGLWVGYRCRGSTNTQSTSGQTLEHIQETRDTAIRPLNNTGSQSCTFKFYIQNHKLLGITKTQFGNLEYSHSTAGQPSVWGLIEPFAVNTIDGTTATVRYNIKITYYCQFTNQISENQNN